MINLDDIKPDYNLDCSGLMCPLPIYNLGKKIKELQPGQTLELLATDSGVESDIPAWCKATNNEYLGLKQEGGIYKLYVRKN